MKQKTKFYLCLPFILLGAVFSRTYWMMVVGIFSYLAGMFSIKSIMEKETKEIEEKKEIISI